MDFVPISIRSPKGGGGGGKGSSSSSGSSSKGSSSKGSKSKSKSKTPKVKGGFFSTSSGGSGLNALPLWARILIFILIIVLILFIVAFIHYAIRENKRRTAEKRKFRWGRVLWKAVKVATFIGIFTWLFKKFGGGKKEKKPEHENVVYAKIEDGQSVTTNNESSHNSWMNNNPPAAAAVPADPYPTQYQPPSQKYEPMSYPGYNPAYAGSGTVAPGATITDHTPATTSMAPTPAPSMYPQSTTPQPAPPPYGPPPHQPQMGGVQPMAPASTGASADYYNAMPTPPSQAAVSVSPMTTGSQQSYVGGPYQPPPPQQGYYPPPH